MSYAPKCFIYGLTDPRTGDVRYIGRTVSGMRRPKMHGFSSILAKDRTYKANWIRQLRALGLDFGIKILEEVEKEKLGGVEVTWIAKGRSLGWPLTNLTYGGEGGHTGRTFTAEHRAKISAANKGRKLTPEQRSKISIAAKIAAKSRPVNLVHLEKLWSTRRGQKLSEETKAKIGAGNRGKVYSMETRKNIAAARRVPIVELATGIEYESVASAASILGICRRSLSKVLNGSFSQTGGFSFRYA